jgi:uncharacterized protein with von Willebrand factor type A (vWA) domain
MPAVPADPAPLPGHLADNVMHFARVLRQAGLPLGTDRIQLALRALQVAGLHSRADFHATLAACFIDRAEHRVLFDQAFELFWREPDLAGRMRAALLPRIHAAQPSPATAAPRRLADALRPPPRPGAAPPGRPPPVELDATLTFSDSELLRRADFDTMSAEEWQQARRLLPRLLPFFEPQRTRRAQAAPRPGRADWRATLQAMARQGGDLDRLRWRQPRTRPAPLVVLADISGSMSRYSRMLLHFAHALGSTDLRVECFVFGTRLSRITRHLRARDPDVAVAQVARTVQDWSGGTRIRACLHQFNRHWTRRVQLGNATVLLVTDGLEHGDTAGLAFETGRLARSCRRLVWLNPLLRYDRFEPRAAGIRAMLPQVDALLPAHNLDSLAQLAQWLSGPGLGAQHPRLSGTGHRP